jgi:hypothetical protein
LLSFFILAGTFLLHTHTPLGCKLGWRHPEHEVFIMPHGDASDFAGYACMAAGIALLAKPQLAFEAVGPVQPLLPAGGSLDGGVGHLVSLCGGLLLLTGMSLFIVRWNTINGPWIGTGHLIVSGVCANVSRNMDGGAFVLRPWLLFSMVHLAAFLHLLFNPNPAWTSAALLEKEKAKAAKKAAKQAASKTE